MREIKFRAWFHGAGDPRVEPYMKYSHPFPVLFWQAVDEFPVAVEIMQFTGLHWDGKEVYEGDIFNRKCDKRHKDGGYIAGTSAYHPENSNVVVYHRGCFMVGFGTLQEFLIFASHEGHHQDLCGNIYENPELIEETA